MDGLVDMRCGHCGHTYRGTAVGETSTVCPVCFPPPPSVSASELVKYPSNVLEGFGAGCLMDFRMKLAVELLKSPMFQIVPGASGAVDTDIVAQCALDIAISLVRIAESRGLIESLPTDNGDLTPELRAQAKRTASFQVLQQMEGQRFMQDEQARVVPAAPVFPHPAGRRGH